MRKHVFVVTGAEAGVTLAQLLVRRLDLDPKAAATRVAGGSVYVDRRRQTEAGVAVAPGQKVVVHEPPAQGPPPTLVVAYQDREVAVVVKPSGVCSVPDRRGGSASISQLAEQRWGPGARLLHRLDRDASGLLLVSRKAGKVRRALADQIAGRRLGRRYLALVTGAPVDDALVIDTPLAVEAGVTRASSDPRARRAVSRVRIVRRGARSLLQVTLETGRTHQIRAHLSGAGLPIIGDRQYGGIDAPRFALHAHCLVFRHPRSGETLELHSPLPPELRLLMEGP